MRLIFSFILTLIAASFAMAETRIVSGKSDEDLALNTTFNGKDILVYGAVQSDEDSPIDVVIVVRGPDQTVTINKKESKLGFWLNSESIKFPNAPAYLAVMSSWGPTVILSPEMRAEHKIGIDEQIDLSKLSGNITNAADFREAFIRIRKENGQFVESSYGVRVEGGVLFSADIPLPANLIEGIYTFHLYVIQDKNVTAYSKSYIPVRKTGAWAWLFNLSDQNGLLYGLLAVFLSITISLIATQFVRLFRR